MGWRLQLHATWELVVMGPGSRFAWPGRRGFAPEFPIRFSNSQGRHCERSEAIQTPSFRDGALVSISPQMCNCTSGNLEIPGSMLRIAPEWRSLDCILA